jgi:hypothetical protein
LTNQKMAYFKPYFNIATPPGSNEPIVTCIDPYIPDYSVVHQTILEESQKNPKFFETKTTAEENVCAKFVSKKREGNCKTLLELYFQNYKLGQDSKLEISEIVGAKRKMSYERIHKKEE